MSDESAIRHALTAAHGAATLAIHMLEHGHSRAEVITTLEKGFAGEPQLHRQTCPADQHRDWWADSEDDLPCPWCLAIAALAAVEEQAS